MEIIKKSDSKKSDVKKSDVKRSDVKELRKLSEKEILEKEEFERLYIDEEKSIAEIKNIYGCSWYIIEKKLKKYEIFIRPRGSFLLDDDDKTLKSKLINGEISSSDYSNISSKRRGFKNNADYQQKKNYEKGIGTGLSMYENKESPQYLGIIIAERILPLIFDDVERMPNGNPGYDFICNKGYKIDVKSACLRIRGNNWNFYIGENKVADYFFIVTFDNREDLNVMHMWLIKSDEKIRTYGFYEFNVNLNERMTFTISNSEKILKRYVKYEIDDEYKLEEVRKVCDDFKKSEKLKEGEII